MGSLVVGGGSACFAQLGAWGFWGVVGGFNTNIRYKRRTFHVQTEAGGVDSPEITTLLYEGGAILHSKKSSYKKHLKNDDLEARVRTLMESQHKAMVKSLKAGKLEAKIARDDAPDPSEVFGVGIITSTPLVDVIWNHFSE